MSSKILSEKHNPLYRRREFEILTEAETTPSMADATTLVADMTNSNGENITVRRIKGRFGVKTILIKADVYENAESKGRFGTFKKRVKKKKKTVKGGKK
jgi:ribosomal protein S24E